MQHLPPQPPGSQVTQSLLVVPYEVLHDSNHLRDQSKSQALENKDYRTMQHLCTKCPEMLRLLLT